MIFGINLTQLRPFGMGGMEIYARRVVERLGKVGRPDDRFLVFIDERKRDAMPAVPDSNVELVPLDTAGPLKRGEIGPWLKEQFESSGARSMLFPLNLVFPLDLELPVVVTMFDIQHEYFPEFFPAEELESRRARYRPSAEKAGIVLTISEFCKRQLTGKFRLPESRVRVAHLAAGPQFRPRAQDTIARVRQEYGLLERYLYYPAAAWPHKNHAFLFAVVKALWAAGRPIELVLSTYVSDAADELRSLACKQGLATGQVRFLGTVPDDVLPAIYAGATALVFPSLYEGFGIPLVEAMSCGCPVISSPRGALSEVGGDAPLLVDPEDVAAWVGAVESVMDDEGVRAGLVAAGLERAKKFSWEDCAQSAVQALRDAASTRATMEPSTHA